MTIAADDVTVIGCGSARTTLFRSAPPAGVTLGPDAWALYVGAAGAGAAWSARRPASPGGPALATVLGRASGLPRVR